jgi:hypothetical protein
VVQTKYEEAMSIFFNILSVSLLPSAARIIIVNGKGHATMDALFLLGLAIFFQCLSINTKEKAE